ncbi:hypothetical protein Poli38472_007449 [Pythium oligandrum]|uniref:Uncharacterized protein n=1 Tax=Pythium oligandrum TaxID=41045 RepID=A0A8K1CQ68_PYTOL|nr:hypothetical protein Poli38472_007449 [Pythium oligandrum]|eukprot:TMW67777.1 hypothetical protein Poli38472_007449 [Pythium oligandrum]
MERRHDDQVNLDRCGRVMSDAVSESANDVEQHVEEEKEEVAAALPPLFSPVPQAYRSQFNETIAPPSGPLSRVIRPPIDFPPESKRAQLIENAEVDLEEDMEALKAAVHAYNVDFQRRIDEVKTRGRILEEHIGTEYEAMEESMNQLQDSFKKFFQTSFLSMEQKILSHFARVEAHDVADEERKIRDCDADARHFFYTTVPEIMENLQGTITRKLEKNHETFDIENAKIQKRERKTLGMLEGNEKRTASNFEMERDRRKVKFQEREEDFHHVMRVDNRATERQQSNQMETLVALQRQLDEEARVRQRDDVEVLDKLSASFHRLQSSILENLGKNT